MRKGGLLPDHLLLVSHPENDGFRHQVSVKKSSDTGKN
jgi:hypothetical protein